MSKKIIPLAEIYQSINVSTLESLGYEDVTADDFSLSAFKRVRIDEENTTAITINIKHPVYVLLDWNTHRSGKIINSLSEVMNPDKKKSEKEKFYKKMEMGLQVIHKSICSKESHKGEETNQMRLALYMGDYSGTPITFTKDEIDVIKEWSPLSAKIILYGKLLDKYNNEKFLDDKPDEWHDSHWKQIKELSNTIIEDLWRLNQLIIDNGCEIKDIGGHKLEIVEIEKGNHE